MSHEPIQDHPNFVFDDEQAALFDTSTSPPNTVLSGKPGEVLNFLIKSQNKILSVSEIQQSVWGNTIVTAGSVKDYIAQIRAALHDSAAAPAFIETVRGRGYRYLDGISASKSQSVSPKLQPTLAIIPPLFTGEKDQSVEILGEIMAAILIDSVSRSPLINVISRLSTRQFRDGNADLDRVGQTLGADYLLSGMYYRQNSKLVLFIELSHVCDSSIVWADQVSGNVSEWSSGNSHQLKNITRDVADKIILHQIDLTNSEPIESLALHTMIINAITFMHSSSQLVFNRSEILLQHAKAREPKNAAIYSLLAQWHLMRMNRSQGWSLSANAIFRDSAFRYAGLALEINPLHAHANTIIGSLEARLNSRFDKALDHHNTAMNTNPNSALNHCFKASASTYQDNPSEGEAAVYHAKKAISLSPLDPQLYLFKTVSAAANQYAGNLEEAHRFATESYKSNPNHMSNLRTLISILVDLQRGKEASRLKDKLMRLDPTFTMKAYRQFGPGIQSHYGQHTARNLEEAGVPAH